MSERTTGPVPGFSGSPRRRSQLRRNSPVTTTLPMPWSAPIDRARVELRDGEPVDEAEHGGGQPADDPGRNHVVARGREAGRAGRLAKHIEDERRREQTEREHDQHRVDRMSGNLCLALHFFSSGDNDASPHKIVILRPSGTALSAGRMLASGGAVTARGLAAVDAHPTSARSPI